MPLLLLPRHSPRYLRSNRTVRRRGSYSSPILDCLQSLHGPICEALGGASQRKGAVSHSLTDLLGMFLNPPQTGKPRTGDDSFRYHCQSLFYPCTHPIFGFLGIDRHPFRSAMLPPVLLLPYPATRPVRSLQASVLPGGPDQRRRQHRPGPWLSVADRRIGAGQAHRYLRGSRL